MSQPGLHFPCLLVLMVLQLACTSQAPPTGSAYTGGSSAADGGTASAVCVTSAACNAAESCLVYCEAGTATHGCHPPEPQAVGIGEACSGKTCNEGICAAGGGNLSPARCMRFCDPAAGCAPGERCETRDVSYGCEKGATRFRLSLCLPGA